MTLGLKRGTVEIANYDPAWPQMFEREKSILVGTLGDKLIALEHVGSTSVAGLASKPIIDMVGAVDSFDELNYFIEKLQKLGYEYMPERMFAERKFFPKGPRENRTYHLNLVIKDNPQQWQDVILFRDYLRHNQVARDQYADLKKTLASKHNDDRYTYTRAKNDFIQQALRDANRASS